MIKMPPEKLSKDDMAGFEEEEEDDLPLPILKRKNVSRIKLYGFLAFWGMSGLLGLRVFFGFYK